MKLYEAERERLIYLIRSFRAFLALSLLLFFSLCENGNSDRFTSQERVRDGASERSCKCYYAAICIHWDAI